MTTPAPPAAAASEDLIDLPELVRTFNRYKWGILGLTVLTALGSILFALSLTPIYRGTVTVLIEPRANRVVQQVQDVYDPGFGTYEYYGTQYEILRSRELATRTVDELKLYDDPEFAPRPPSLLRQILDWRNWLPFLPKDDAPVVSDELKAALQREATIQGFQARTFVQSVPQTQLVRVHFDAESPELAARVANALAERFINSGLQAKLEATVRATQFLTSKLDDIKKQLEESEARLQAFRESQKIVNVGGSRGIAESELMNNLGQLRDAQKRASELSNAAARIQQAGGDPRRLQDIPVLLQDEGARRANAAWLAAQEAMRQLQERYGDKHPQMAAAKARADQAQSAYFEQLRVAAQGVRTEYELAKDNERSLAGIVARDKDQLRGLDQKNYEIGVLERDVQSNRELYNLFLTRFKETDNTGNYENVSARIIDPAVTPQRPYRPQKKKIVLFATLAGLLLGVVLALLRHILSEEIRGAEDVEALTALPVFGVLPRVAAIGGKRSCADFYREQPKTPFAEGIRSIRASLQLSDIDRKFSRLMVTSSVPKEGKSSVASTLALSFGAVERVLLVETDLRLPTLHKVFGLPKGAPGVSELLSGQATLENCLYPQGNTGVTLLPAGMPPPNPAEVIASERFARLIDELSQNYDRVIFDSPPCQAASDTLLLARLVDAVLFVIKADATSRRVVKNAVKQLRQVQAPLVGTVVNQLDTRRNPYYQSSYYYAYGGYYG